MQNQSIAIAYPPGLNAEAATIFVQKANTYRSSIWVEHNASRVNAKSLLGLLSLGLAAGEKITLIVEGVDESEATRGLLWLIETNFDTMSK